MRAIVCSEFASPDQLELSDIPSPQPKSHEVLIDVKATGLGYVDALTVAGLYQIRPALPFVPGNEVSGVVSAIGSDVSSLKVGQRILAMPSYGGLAEQVCIPAAKCIAIPQVLSHEGAAGFQVNYCTAYHGLVQCGQLQAGETLLILGAAGGVGVAAIDVAKAIGARVIAAASTEEKRQSVLALGADEVLDYSAEDWRAQLKSLLGGRALDAVYDPVGGAFSEPALRSLSPGGRFLVVGFAGGGIASIPLNLTLLKRCSIVGVNWGGYIAANPSEAAPVMQQLMDWIEAGQLRPTAGQSFSLEQAGSAMMKMLNREALGKLVISQ